MKVNFNWKIWAGSQFIYLLLCFLSQSFFGCHTSILVTLGLMLNCFQYLIIRKTISQPLARLKSRIGLKNNEDLINGIEEFIEDTRKEIEESALFIGTIEQGNLEATIQYQPEIKKSILKESLLKMQQQLRTIAEEERQRNWSSQGLATFNDILRTHENTENLYSNILSSLIKHLSANQGTLFITKEENKKTMLELVAYYAYDRKKYIEKMIDIGEGLVGQAYLEKETIYLTEIPDKYVTITSGLGEATPKALLIVPLKYNEEVQGVLEIASFRTFPVYQISFLEKLGENVAAAISNTKINTTTKKLLKEATEYAEQVRSQEEELRQNLEELQATQEAHMRAEQEVKAGQELLLKKLEELEKVKKLMEEKEAQLIEVNEKNKIKTLKFKNQMEELDLELEKKNSEINILKRTIDELKQGSQFKNSIN